MVWREVDHATEYRILLVDIDSAEQEIYSPWTSAFDSGCGGDGLCRFTLSVELVGRKKWRIRARNEFGATQWSPRTDYTTLAVSEPDVVSNLISPIGEQSVVPDALRWQGADGAALYRVLLVDVSSGVVDIFSPWISAQELGCVTGGDCVFTLSTEFVGQKKWRIKTRNTAGDSDWSEKQEYLVLP